MSFEDYQISRWETPVSNIQDAVLVKLFKNDEYLIHLPSENELSDCGSEPPDLTIVIGGAGESRQFRFVFNNCSALKIVKEEYATELWRKISEDYPVTGRTAIVKDSPWIAELRKSEFMFELHSANSQHYLFFTMDYLLEIISNEPPLIEQIT